MPDTGEKPKKYTDEVTTIQTRTAKNWTGSGEAVETQGSKKAK